MVEKVKGDVESKGGKGGLNGTVYVTSGTASTGRVKSAFEWSLK